MKKIFLILSLLFESFLSIPERKLLTNDQDDSQLNNHVSFKQSDFQKTVECNKDLLISYGMNGIEKAELRTHMFCPNITENCCSDDDAIRSKYLWNNQNRFYLERYYETYLLSMKYLLGFSNEAFLLARKLEVENIKECKNAAVDLIAMDFNPETTLQMYQKLKQSIQKIIDLRKGFYCVLCDGKIQEELQDFWLSTNEMFRDRLYFSKEFCHQLVEENLKASFQTLAYVKRYLDNLTILINCQVNDEKLTYEIDIETITVVKNCYYFKDKYFYFFCEKYCEKFKLTSPDPLLDGDLLQLQKFVLFVKKNRHQAFQYPNNNFLCDGVNFEEDLLTFNYKEVLKDLVFFRPTQQQVMLDKFKTDIVYYGGINPYLPTSKNNYTMILNGSPFLASIPILFLIYSILM